MPRIDRSTVRGEPIRNHDGRGPREVWHNAVIEAHAEAKVGIEPSKRLRAPGADDRPAIDKESVFFKALDGLVRPGTRVPSACWTLESTDRQARELQTKEFGVLAEFVRRLLHQMGYSLRAPAILAAIVSSVTSATRSEA